MVKSLVGRGIYLVCNVDKKRSHLVLVSFVIGCMFANELGIPSYIEFLAIIFIILGIIFPKYLLVLMAFLLGITRVYSINSQTNHISDYTNNKVRLTAIVGTYPSIKGADKVLVLEPQSISFEGMDTIVKNGLVQTSISKYIEISKGDIVMLEMDLAEPESSLEFDYVGYLKSNNIYAIGKNVKVLDIKRGSNSLELATNSLRGNIVSKINKTYPDPHAKLLAGMLIGTREQFSPDFANNLSISSTTHVVAVSGYNISLIINTVMSMAGYINRKVLIYSCYVGLIGFVLLVGVDNVPAVRATLMGFALLLGMARGRRSSGLLVLLFVAVLMHIQNPFTYKSLSFQLSFVATFGLMVFNGHLSKVTKKIFPKFLNEDIGSTFTAILFTFPVVFANFGKVTLYALPANILIAPLVPMISFSGVIWFMVSFLDNTYVKLLEGLVWGSLELMIRIINLVATLPYSNLVYSGNLTQVALCVIVIITIILFEFNYREFIRKNE